jgi:hypothetical protein
MTAATTIEFQHEASDQGQAAFRFAGLAVATIFPALFWVAIVAVVSNVAGVALSIQVLAAIGAVIMLFLAIICAPIMLKAQS